MGEKLIELMTAIEQSCINDGYYPDLVELNAMAMAAIERSDKSIDEIIADYNA